MRRSRAASWESQQQRPETRPVADSPYLLITQLAAGFLGKQLPPSSSLVNAADEEVAALRSRIYSLLLGFEGVSATGTSPSVL